MGGKSAPAPVLQQTPSPALGNINAGQYAQNNSGVANIMNQVASGGMSLNDALAGMNSVNFGDPYTQQRSSLQSQIDDYTKMIDSSKSQPDWVKNSPELKEAANKLQGLQNQLGQIPAADQFSGAARNAAINQMFTSPETASILAAQQVQSNPLTSGLFGKGGLQDQAQSRYGQLNSEFDGIGSNLDEDRNSLKGNDQSYGLTDTDLAAYGQGSANIARMFGGAEQNLAQSLADRGLAAGGSGAAPQLYSGLMGNKNEQLAQLQTNIAQNRIQTAQQLAQARTNADLSRMGQMNTAIGANNSMIQGLGSQAEQDLRGQQQANLGGSENSFNQSMGANNANLANYSTEQNAINEATAAANQGKTGNSAGQMIGAGLGAVGGGLIAGPAGAAAGASIGGGLGSST